MTARRTRIRRNARRAVYDRPIIDAVLDRELLCHVAYVNDGEPRIIPTLYIREGDTLYLHGNRQSALLAHIAAGEPVSIGVTLLDGIVVARSAFHCSVNYRSVTLFGRGHLLADDVAIAVLDRFVERLIPGHLSHLRASTPQELAATAVVAVAIEECAAKIRTGDPIDDDGDLAAPVWAGVIPVQRTTGQPVPSADLHAGITLPAYIDGWQYPDAVDA
ncbi:MAG: pyridoxamine 5'-phosphate oxidase family protein [Pseudomonadales bacterium]|nr:pyridoxamine 5'-phosphate oxidase family protein [Pseudomonadales bacterium]MCP5186070.1 pyridoxamine 5'-phosphate oxidase family protein [Pseudomonadales bacterium]